MEKRLFDVLLFQALIIIQALGILGIIIFPDPAKYHIVVFMCKYHNQLLPPVFKAFFYYIHCYNTRHASKLSYYLHKVRTNYRKFNNCFQSPMIWNSVNEDLKCSSFPSFTVPITPKTFIGLTKSPFLSE